MIDDLGRIPSAVRRDAIAILASQPSVPVSPLRARGDGDVDLCAAAALAIANAADEDAGRDLIRDMQARGVPALLDAFERFGWSKGLASRVLVNNDAFGAERRKDGVIAFLSASLKC